VQGPSRSERLKDVFPHLTGGLCSSEPTKRLKMSIHPSSERWVFRGQAILKSTDYGQQFTFAAESDKKDLCDSTSEMANAIHPES
jgi:hypothetical protein